MNRQLIVIFAALMLLSCGQPPTVPRTDQAPTLSSSTAAGDSTTPTSPAPLPAPVGPSGESFSWRIVSVGDRWKVELTNNERTRPVFVACYEDPDRNIATQTLHHYTGSEILGGKTKVFSAAIPCGQWQCDAVEGEFVPKTSPFFGSNLIVGRIGRRSGGACDPPPPPPPPVCTDCPPPPPPPVCNVSELVRDATLECGEEQFSIDTVSCTFECDPPPPPECDTATLTSDAVLECGDDQFELDFGACTFACLPPPPPECTEASLLEEAVPACGEAGVKSLDTFHCTFECNQKSQKSKKSDKSDKSKKKVYVCHVDESGKENTLKLIPEDVFEHVPGHHKDYLGKCHK